MSVFLSACVSSLNENLKENTALPQLDSVNTLVDVSSVGFEWKFLNDEAVQGFVVYRAQSLSGKGLQRIAIIKNRFATHYYDTGLSPQTKYIYAFATLGGDKDVSPKGEPIHIQTSFIDAVESVFAINNQPRSIKLIWSPHANPSVETYLLQRLNKAGEFETIAHIPHRLSVEYFDSDLKDGETYTYRVIAKNFEGIESKPSKSVSVSTIPQPAPIENLHASNDMPRAINLSWEAAPDTQGVSKKYYKILYSSDDKDYKTLATTNQTHYTHKLKADENGISYYYQVVLIGDNGLEGRMNTQSAKGSSLPPPSQPTHFEGKIIDDKATLSWQIPSDDRIQSFIVYRYEGAIWAQSTRFVDIEGNSFVDKEMQKGKKYSYSVVSVDKNGIESAPTKKILLSVEAQGAKE